MRYFNRIGKPISIWLIVSMLNLYVLPLHSWAASSEANPNINSEETVLTDRERLKDLIQRQEVLEELKRHGVTEEEALARIDALTDEEVVEINGKLDQLPAGAILFGDPVFEIIFAAVYLVVTGVMVIGGAIILTLSCPFSEKPYWDCMTMGKFSSTDSSSNTGSESETIQDDTEQYKNMVDLDRQTCRFDCNEALKACLNLIEEDENSALDTEQCQIERKACFDTCEEKGSPSTK